MKKFGLIALMALLLALLCVFGVSAATAEQVDANVLAGYEMAAIPTDAQPITSATEFAAMQADGVYYLDADITLGFAYGEFSGKLYGNGHTITATSVNVFDKLNGAEVYDLTLAGSVAGTGNHVGGLATEAYGATLVGIINEADVTNTGSGWMIVGGVIGYAENTTLRYCVNYGTISGGSAANNEARPGGIVGQIDNANAWLVIENCVNYGDINGINQTGGILARSQNSASVTVKSCVNFGRVFVGSSDSGAIAGKIACAGTAVVENCINSGRVYGGSFVGMIGYGDANKLYITNCYNGCVLGCTTDCEHGVLSSRSGNLGAILGGYNSSARADSILEIKNCTNTADLLGGGLAAGIAGNVTAKQMTFENCTNSGNVTTTGAVAGIVAACADNASTVSNATFRNCVNTGKVKTTNGVGGGLVAYCDATGTLLVENCFNGCLAGCTASCDHGKVECTSHGAGIVAHRDVRAHAGSKIIAKNCTNTGRLVCGGSSSGGILGWVGATTIEVTDCFNGCQNGCASCDHGVVSLTKSNNMGGIVGCVEGTDTLTVKNCVNNADLSLGGTTGGITGGVWTTQHVLIENCYNYGDISNKTYDGGDIGGISGGLATTGVDITIKNCTNEGNISSDADGCDPGGILGGAEQSSIQRVLIENCVNKGDITTTNSNASSARAGGIAGPTSGQYVTFKNCTNYGTLNTRAYSAGIVSRAEAKVALRFEGCINQGDVTSREYCSGIMGWVPGTNNITCIDVHNKGNISCPNGAIGGILGNWQNGAATLYFENCSNSGTLTGHPDYHIGGIISWADNAANVITIKNCHNTASFVSSKYNVAGIAGCLNGTVVIENCSNSGNMTQTTSTHEDSGAAGIVGLVKNGGEGTLTIIGCSNTGNISAVDGNAAGILGRSFAANSTIIKNCTNSGSCITSATARYVKEYEEDGTTPKKYKDNAAGGITGIVNSLTITIENCHNGCFSGCTTDCTHGQVTCNSFHAAGIIAYNYTAASDIIVKNCSNSGKIHANNIVGGIVGGVTHNTLIIENCSNGCFNGCTPAEGEYCVHGMISNTANVDFGGILGQSNGGNRVSLTVKNCYNDGRISGKNRGGGITGVIQSAKILLQGNVNKGDVTAANNYSAGMFGRIDNVSNSANTVDIIDCINRGDLSQPNNYGGGFVGYMATVGVLTMVNCHNYGDVAVGWQGAGLLAGVDGGVLEISMTNCSNSGTITNGRTDIDINSGGLIGAYWGGASTKATFIDCHNYGNVSNTNALHSGRMGGLIGRTGSTTTIKNCSNSGNITLNVAKNPNNSNEAVCEVGGMIGMKDGGNLFVDNFVNEGAIHGDVDHDLWNSASGGFIGAIRGDCNATVKNSVNRGKITNYPGAAAGMLGFRHGSATTMVSFIGCKNYGEIVAESRYATGGIGYAYKSFEFIDCENHGKIDATANGVAGGLLGRKNANADSAKCSVSFVNCLNTGLITGKGQCGGIAAAVDSASFFDVINCKNTGEIKNTSNWNSGVGGLVGLWGGANGSGEAHFISCVNEGYVTDGTKGRVGGILGVSEYSVTENNAEVADKSGAHGNILFRDCINKGNVNSNGNYAGGIVCRVDFIKGGKTLTIENCTNEGTITGKVWHMGGILGYFTRNADSNAVIKGCVNTGDVSVASAGQAGGIAGVIQIANITIENCSNSGKISGQGSEDGTGQTGGIAGYVTAGTQLTVRNCTNTGNIVFSTASGSNARLGGIIGYSTGKGDALIENCLNRGTVGATNIKTRPGGIVGGSTSSNIIFRNCTNAGNVNTSHYAGGIICRIDFADNKKATFENCTNEGSVTGNGVGIAGIFGWCEDNSGSYTIEFINCVNRGTISANGAGTGGIAGSFSKSNGTATYTNCYNYGHIVTTSGRAGGIAGDMQAKCTFTNCYNGCDKNCTTACNHGKVESASCDAMGGIVARQGTYGITMINCTNDANLNGPKSVGGIAGELHGGEVTHTLTGCVNNGNVTSSGNYAAGMYCISYKTIVLTNCHNTGNITANYAAGGLIARPMDAPSLTLKGCSNSGNVKSKGVGGAGGLLGSLYATYDITDGSSRPVTIENCHNSGNVTLELAKMESNEGVGGLIGILQSRVGTVTIKNCSNSGTITATITERTAGDLGIGGAIGLIPETVNDGTRTVTVSELEVDGFTNSGNITGSANGLELLGGLFGFLTGTGDINVTVKNSVNHGTISSASTAAVELGGLVGRVLEPIAFTNCKNYGSVTITKGAWGAAAGGFIGTGRHVSKPTLTDCTNYGDISSSSSGGGVVGWLHGGETNVLTLNNCVNRGTVHATGYSGSVVGYTYKNITVNGFTNYANITGDNRVGGLIGEVNFAGTFSFTNAINYGDVTCLDANEGSDNEVGGLVGNFDGASTITFTNCENHGNVSTMATNKYHVGGLVGECGGTVTFANCVNTGNVTSNYNVGGIIAYCSQPVTLTSCINTGTIVGHGAQSAGGLVGECSKAVTLSKCINTGNVTGDGRVAGLVGGAWASNSKIEYCYVSGKITNTLASCGTTTEDGAFGASGLIAYQYGPVNMYYNVVAADIVAKYDDPLYESNAALIYRNVSALANYVNNKDFKAQYNVFIGTLDGGLYGRELYLAVQKNNGNWNGGLEGGVANFSNNIHHNYSNVKIPLYLDQSLVYGETVGADGSVTYTAEAFPIVLASTAANDVVSTMNGVAGAGTFVVNNGVVIHKNAVSTYEKIGSTVIPPEHTHSYATTYTSDVNGHWYACSCGAVKDYAAHVYTNACDTTCDTCGKTRTVDATAHVYAGVCDTTCENCSATRTVSNPVHVYTNACDTTCNNCGATRTVADSVHVYAYACDTTCENCSATRTVADDAHVYTDACDTTCNFCEAERTVNSHVYSGDCDATCDRCGAERTAPGTHAGQYACSATCKVCGVAVTPGAHTYSNSCDAACDLCGTARTEGLVHSGAYACATECQFCHAAIEATGEHVYGNTCDLTCDKCGFVRELPADSHTYTNGCDNSCNNCGYVRADSELVHTNNTEVPCDTACTVCGKTIAALQPHTGAYSCADECQWCGVEVVPGAHTPEKACSETCKDCGAAVPVEQAHTFANPCDPDCDLCGKTRTELTHTFENDCDKDCAYCAFTREIPVTAHVYAYKCDATCERCDFVREISIGDHVYPYPCADTCLYCETELVPGEHTHEHLCSDECLYCGAEIAPLGGHEYSGACDLICNRCGFMRDSDAAHQYTSDCDASCNICGFMRDETAAHVRDYACSVGCANCGAVMDTEPEPHTYTNACDKYCDVCQVERTHDDEGNVVDHAYENRCDATCDKCGEVRVVLGHKGEFKCSTECKFCGSEIKAELDHKYANACTDTCGYCGEVTRDAGHETAFACSTVCTKCGETVAAETEHAYDNACDTTCNVCGETREVNAHAGEFACSTVCKECGVAIQGAEHAHDNACDTTCNVCGETREVNAHAGEFACSTVCKECGVAIQGANHAYDNACDADCNVCGAEREPAAHSFGDWTVKTPATTEAAGLEERVCASCGEKEEREIAKLQPEEDEGDSDSGNADSGNTDSGNTDSGDSSNSSGDSSNTATEEENGAVGVIVTVVMIVVAVVIVVIVSLIAGGNKKSKPSKKFQTSKKGKKK